MAKKVVATLQKGESKNLVKCIKMSRSQKSGAYLFKEGIVHKDKVKDFFTEK